MNHLPKNICSFKPPTYDDLDALVIELDLQTIDSEFTAYLAKLGKCQLYTMIKRSNVIQIRNKYKFLKHEEPAWWSR